MRVFVDTNVLVSALATRGLSADAFRLVLARHRLLTSEGVLEELERVLREKIGAPPWLIEEALALLREHHVEPVPERPPPVDVRDASDEPILAAAVAAGAEVLLTGDRDLLALDGRVPALRILDPRAFWELARGEGADDVE